MFLIEDQFKLNGKGNPTQDPILIYSNEKFILIKRKDTKIQ